MIYRYIVVGTGKHAWGQRSGLETAILRTSSTVAEEAIEQMYNTKMLIAIDPHTCSDCPPACGLSRMVHINLEVSFETENRGDSEMSIHDAGKLKAVSYATLWIICYEAHSPYLQHVMVSKQSHCSH